MFTTALAYKVSVLSMFQNSDVTRLPGGFGGRMEGYPLKHIFEPAPYPLFASKEDAAGPPSLTYEGLLGRRINPLIDDHHLSKIAPSTYGIIKTKTINNEYFDVKQGTPVELLVISPNENLSTMADLYGKDAADFNVAVAKYAAFAGRVQRAIAANFELYSKIPDKSFSNFFGVRRI